jgi:hypothetical protein
MSDPFGGSASLVDMPAAGNMVDLAARYPDIDQLLVAQVVQRGPQLLALAPLLKHTPILLEQTRYTANRCCREVGWK